MWRSIHVIHPGSLVSNWQQQAQRQTDPGNAWTWHSVYVYLLSTNAPSPSVSSFSLIILVCLLSFVSWYSVTSSHKTRFFPGHGMIHIHAVLSISVSISFSPPPPPSCLPFFLCSIDWTISPLAAIWQTIIWWWSRVHHFTMLSSPLGLCCGIFVYVGVVVWMCVWLSQSKGETVWICACVILWVCVGLISSLIGGVFTLIHELDWCLPISIIDTSVCA